MRIKHIYACIFKCEDGKINISFPDFGGALICATTEKEALEHTKKAGNCQKEC